MQTDLLSSPPENATAPAFSEPFVSLLANRERGTQWRVIPWLRRTLSAAEPADYRRVFQIFAGVLTTLFLLAVLHGPVLQVFYGHDDLGILSFAWRIQNGIFPNADYHIPLGPLHGWIHAAGMSLLGPTASVLPVCNAVVGLAIGFLAWTVAARRLPAVLAGVFAFTQATEAMSPHLMRFEWFASTYDCYYNRQCFGLITVVMLAAFLPPRVEDRRLEIRDDRTLGVLLGLLVFLKITFFMGSAGFCGLAFLAAKRPRRLLSGNLLGAFLLTVLLCLPMIRFDVFAMLADLRMAAEVRRGNPAVAVTFAKAAEWLWDARLELILLGTAQLTLRAPLFFRRSSGRAAWPMAPSWAEFAGVVGVTILLNMTNAQGGSRSETPLLTSWLFVLAGYALRARGVSGSEPHVARQPDRVLVMTCVLACTLWGYTFGPALCCQLWSTSPWPTPWIQEALAVTGTFDSPSLAPLRIMGLGGEPPQPHAYIDKVNDGMRLLRGLGGVHRVGALDFNNPFPFALQWPPPQGDYWTWVYAYSFTTKVYPTGDEGFGDADIIMMPKFAGEVATLIMMKHVYGAYLIEHFTLAAESEQWYLLRRK